MSRNPRCPSTVFFTASRLFWTHRRNFVVPSTLPIKLGFSGVKLNLYQGLPDVIVRNSALCGAILDMLYRHAVVLGINRPNAICPIDFDDTIYESGFVAQVKVSISTR